MTAVIDYGVGNLFSLMCSLKAVGESAVLTDDPARIEECDRVILPGVGAFGDAADKLALTGLDKVVKEQVKSGKLLLGICLGMQLLFEKSFEDGEHKGLGIISGQVESLKGYVPQGLDIPQMGWNALSFPLNRFKSPLYKYVDEGEHVYFVHSYHAVDCEGFVSAVCDYGAPVTASVEYNNVFGTQYHPEKSGTTGLAVLKAFCEIG